MKRKNIKEIIRDEFKKCATDAVHFFRKYATIQHPLKGKIIFNLYDFQEKAIREFQTHRYNIVLKGRQLGLSTLVAGYALWKMIFHDDYKVLVIATTQDVAKELVSKVQLMYEKLPTWIRSTAKADTFNKLELTFKNGSAIKAVSSSEKSARSPSVSLLIIDEAAFIEKFDDIWSAAQATLATGGDSIILSTPNGMGNKFHELYSMSEDGYASGNILMNAIKLPWNLHPDRDAAWAEAEQKVLGPRKFAQEHDCNFLASGHTVIEADILAFYKENMIMEPIERRYSGDFWIWKYPDYLKDFIVVADVARGDGEDYSSFHIFEIESMEQYGSFKAKVGTREFGNLLVNVATEWNTALLVIDNKAMGWDVVQVAIDRGYKNLYYSYKNDPYFDENIHLRKNHDLKDKKDMVPGLTTGHKVRMNMISKLEIYMLERSVILKCLRTLNELYVFVWLNGKPQAQRGYNDDLVMALAMALFVRDTALRMRQAGLALTKRAIGNMHKTVYVTGREDKGHWRMNLGGNKGQEDLRWLIR